MDMFDRYASAFESMAHEADCLMGEYLIHSFIATEADSGFNLKATVQKYWNRLLELLDKFRRFIAEKFQAARNGVKKLIAMLKNRGGATEDDGSDAAASKIVDEVTKMSGFVDKSEDLCKEAEKLSKKIADAVNAQYEEMKDVNDAIDMLEDMTKEFFGKFDSVFSEVTMDSDLEIAAEGIGSIFRAANRISNTLLKTDAIMRAIEHLTQVFRTVTENAKRRYDGRHQNDQKITTRLQSIITRILSGLSKLGHFIISIPSRVMGLIKKARGPRATTEKYDGPDPFAVG